MKEIVYFSYTGTSEKIAKAFSSHLNCSMVGIKPVRSRSYLEWLILSFIPKLGVKILHENIDGDEIILCFPKWTFNCPPITSFIKSGNLKGKRVFMVVACGGWRAESYTAKYAELIEKHRGFVVGWKILRRKYVDEILRSNELFEEVENAFSAAKGD